MQYEGKCDDDDSMEAVKVSQLGGDDDDDDEDDNNNNLLSQSRNYP